MFIRDVKKAINLGRVFLVFGIIMIIFFMVTSLTDLLFKHHNEALFFIMYLYACLAIIGYENRTTIYESDIEKKE